MAVLHETGLIGTPVPVYFETFAPARRAERPTVLMIHGGAHTGACYQRTVDGRPGWAYAFAELAFALSCRTGPAPDAADMCRSRRSTAQPS